LLNSNTCSSTTPRPPRRRAPPQTHNNDISMMCTIVRRTRRWSISKCSSCVYSRHSNVDPPRTISGCARLSVCCRVSTGMLDAGCVATCIFQYTRPVPRARQRTVVHEHCRLCARDVHSSRHRWRTALDRLPAAHGLCVRYET
jgi:hypothetical protein